MCRFIQVNLTNVAELNIRQVEGLFNRYLKFLRDDFSDACDIYSYIKTLIPYFWIVTNLDGKFMGFVYLDNFVGAGGRLYSAELTTCMMPEAWGSYTAYCAKIFLKKCFDEIGLQKITACVYPDNFRVKRLLKDNGFVYESTLINATLRLGKMQNIDVYGLYRSYYY